MSDTVQELNDKVRELAAAGDHAEALATATEMQAKLKAGYRAAMGAPPAGWVSPAERRSS